MIRNYFKIAFRNLIKRKVYSLINILGLATGMAICLLIVLFIKDELNFDKWHKNGDHIYRMVVDRKYPTRGTSYSFIPQSYAQTVKQELPEVQDAVRIFDFNGSEGFQIKYEDKTFEETRGLIADPNFFKVFNASFLSGDPNQALNKPGAVVLTETTAKKYFGSIDNAVGKFLRLAGNDDSPLEVTGVCANWPENSHFSFDLLFTTAGDEDFDAINYVGFAAHTYLLLNKNANPEAVESKFPDIIKRFATGDIEKQFGVSFQQFQAAGNGYRYYLQPLKKIHLISQLEGELRPNGSLTSVYIFGIVAVFILLIACINFINLSTARSAERAKEVGIRKTFGSEKKYLVAQFLTESTLLSLSGMILAVGMVFLLLPAFNDISGKSLEISSLLNASTLGILIAFSFFIGLAAGLYPAFILSSFKPIQVLRGKFKSGSHGLVLRNGLVVFQFAISVVLIICTLIVNKQMNFMTGKKLGFDKEHTIIIRRTALLGENTRAFRNELRKIPGVENVSSASALPGQERYFGVSWLEVGSNEPMTGRGLIVDNQYQKTLGLELKEGRFFSKDFPTDSLAVILNEKAVTELGLRNPVGTRLTSPDGFYNAPDGTTSIYTVIGVVKDFHYQSLHEPIAPLVFTNSLRFNDVMSFMAVRIKGDTFKSTSEAIESKWKEFVKDRPFHFEFLDSTIAAQYQAEITTQKTFTFFSSLAIFIACIGLLGLSAYTTQQRTHEIGIRKVLGASVGNITKMLSKDFMKLVLAATVIAFPVAWFAMRRWLQDFTYRVDPGWEIFIGAGVIALIVALATISFQAIKAAIANPVKSLRTE